MKISVVVPLKERREFIPGLVVNIESSFGEYDYEIIFSCQSDNSSFREGGIINLGFKRTTGDVIVINHVDTRHFSKVDIGKYLPGSVGFNRRENIVEIGPNMFRKLGEDEPVGSGAFVVLTRERFIKAGGCSNLYMGWGSNDISFARYRAKLKYVENSVGHVKHLSKMTDPYWLQDKVFNKKHLIIESKKSDFKDDTFRHTHADELEQHKLGERGIIYSFRNIRVVGNEILSKQLDERVHQRQVARAYFLSRDYRCNGPVPYEGDKISDQILQDSVYRFAYKVSNQYGTVRKILDLGCGNGFKFVKHFGQSQLDLTGIDTARMIACCKASFSGVRWYEDDIESSELNLGEKYDLIIVSDVVEHLSKPEYLFPYLYRLSHLNSKFVISTPDRRSLRGATNVGPPGNRCHVREWDITEFTQLLESFGMEIKEQHLVVNDQPLVERCQVYLTEWGNVIMPGKK